MIHLARLSYRSFMRATSRANTWSAESDEASPSSIISSFTAFDGGTFHFLPATSPIDDVFGSALGWKP